ncbi:MAG: amino acid adenylation domain-containing protein, partial [Caldilineaceae bacterium]|nr:amino acid adenylation domain-containing protein [Caldilineaceae bacterium]
MKVEAPKYTLQNADKALRATAISQPHATPATAPIHPLSYNQQAIWAWQQLLPEDAAYNIAFNLHIRSCIQVPVLRQTIAQIVARHPILQAVYQDVDGQPHKVVQAEQEIDFEVIDAAGWSTDQLEFTLKETYQYPFNLAQQVIRFRLYVLTAEHAVFQVVMHHIAVDGWSLTLLIDEICRLYGALAQDPAATFPPVQHDYDKFVTWQEAWLASDDGQASRDFWRTQLAGEQPKLDLPPSKAVASGLAFVPAQYKFHLDAELVAGLRQLAKERRSTLHSLLLAAFQAFLYRYTGQPRVQVGAPVLGRAKREFVPLVGDFSNIMVLRGDIEPNEPFLHYLHQVTETVQSALMHQHFPFSLLSQELLLTQDSDHGALYQASLNFLAFTRRMRGLASVFVDHTETNQVEYGGFTVSRLDLEAGQGMGRVDLNLDLYEVREDIIHAYLDYNSARFDEATIQRMMAHFLTLLRGIVRNPHQTIATLPLMTAAEEHQLLVEWSGSDRPLPPPALVHECFAQQAQRTPNQIALRTKEAALTYAQIEQRANQLAHYLRQRGVGTETRVGLSLQYSSDMFIALLGILKAGGVYLPLDPRSSLAHLEFMLGEAQPTLILTECALVAQLPHTAQAPVVVCLDEEWSRIQDQPATAPENLVAADHLAYITYPSGAADQRRAVMIPHGALANQCQATIEQFRLCPTDRVWPFAVTNFYTATAKIFPVLLSGATLILSGEEAPAVAALGPWIQEQALTVLELPTAYWHEWVRHLSSGAESLPSCLRLVVVGGEQVSMPLYRQWRQIAGVDTVEWLNKYELPEAAGVSLLYASDGTEMERIPLGRPVAHTQAYILDVNGQPTPVGVPGELHLGGASLACGYLNQPKLTQERFTLAPFDMDGDAQDAPQRLYKTGDWGRFTPDGHIEFLGRIAEQVWIRGFRIAPVAIQAALAEHPAVAECAVVVHLGEDNEKQLVAYIVEQPGAHPLGSGTITSAVRQWLRNKLPRHMMPTAFVLLPALPRTANYSLERSALPAPSPDATSPGLERTRMSETEALVAHIWSDVLHITNVARHDNFFELGGHSLLATQVVSRIKKDTGVLLSLRQLFEEPTVARLAAEVEQERWRSERVSLPPLQPAARVGPTPLSFAQERMWFLQQLAPDNTAYHISLVVRLTGALNVPALEQALNAVVQRHESLRTIFPTKDGVPHQVILAEHTVKIAPVDLTDMAAAKQEPYIVELVNADLLRPFDLPGAPAWRFMLFTCGPEEHVAYFALHHIIFDQWSSAVLWQDLTNYYRAYIQQRPPVVAPAAIQYADYAIWQRGWLQGEALETLLDYWRQQLADAPVLDIPLDKPRPPLQTFRGATEFLTIPEALAHAVRRMSSRMQVSPFMLLLAAFNVLLARYSGQEDIAIGVPVANRHHLDVEPLIGTLVNTLVIRTDVSGEPDFAELVQRVRDVLLDAYAHQDLPFEKLVSEVVEKRDLSYTPLVQVLFNMVNTPFDYENMAELPISLVQFDRGAAQFDLSVTVSIDENMPLEPHLAVEYNVELFERETIRRVLGHYQTLLEAMTAHPHQPIASYPMLSAGEIEQQTSTWNQTTMDYPHDRCLHELVAMQAQKTPDKMAITFGQSSMSYRELNERSNQLAHYLQAMGVGPETVVGVFVERSLDMVVGLLGILKAGGAYLPLDPNFPAERLAFMVADAAVQTILTSADLTAQAPEMATGNLVCLDSDWPAIAQQPTTLPAGSVQAHNLAYLIYTSGSTGKPKGVQIEHRNVVNFLTAMRQQPGLEPDDVLLAVTTLSFDISILEIFLPLVSGAQVVIADRIMVVDGRELLRAMRQHRVTVMQATPTTWSMLVEAGWRDTPTLRKVLCGGEALSRPLADAILERDVALWNMYGPTETTIWSAVWPVHPDDGQVPIGRPIGNNQLYVLDPLGKPAPIGVAGELFIGGDGVARGYRNRPELTAQRFVPNSFALSEQPNARIYRTGDA